MSSLFLVLSATTGLGFYSATKGTEYQKKKESVEYSSACA
jgi:hypothetical protein